MPAILVDRWKTTVHEPITLRARMTVDRGAVVAQYRQRKINTLPQLWPHGELRNQLMHGAKKWVSDMGKQGFELLTAEADVTVTGPYAPRNLHGKTNQFGATVEDQDDVQNAHAADFVLEATFLSARPITYETKDS